jgi:hypothetical protein
MLDELWNVICLNPQQVFRICGSHFVNTLNQYSFSVISASGCIFGAEMLGIINHLGRHFMANRAKSIVRLPVLAVLMVMLLPAMQALGFTSFQPCKAIPFASKQVQARPTSPGVTCFAALLPFESVPSGLEIEILEEAELEDDLDEYWTNIVSAIFSNEEFYTSSERSRLLHHHSSLHNRQTVPYFILYHSWKSYLA